MWIAALLKLVDGTKTVGGGALRGCGRQKWNAIFMFIGYFVISIPIGVCFAYPLHMGSAGLWWGLTIGMFFMAGITSFMVSRLDWVKESILARQRVKVHNPTVIRKEDETP